jgi:hypothetical protein
LAKEKIHNLEFKLQQVKNDYDLVIEHALMLENDRQRRFELRNDMQSGGGGSGTTEHIESIDWLTFLNDMFHH